MLVYNVFTKPCLILGFTVLHRKSWCYSYRQHGESPPWIITQYWSEHGLACSNSFHNNRTSFFYIFNCRIVFRCCLKVVYHKVHMNLRRSMVFLGIVLIRYLLSSSVIWIPYPVRSFILPSLMNFLQLQRQQNNLGHFHTATAPELDYTMLWSIDCWNLSTSNLLNLHRR